MSYGFNRGYVGALGMVAGLWTALSVVAVGLEALLLASSHAFAFVKWLGVGYLNDLGVKQWRAPVSALVLRAVNVASDPGAFKLFMRGWAVNATNSKRYVFMFAVMPQFVDATRPLLAQYLIIGLTLSLTDLIVIAGYAALAAKAVHLIKTPASVRRLNRIFGAMFVSAAVALALFRRES